MNDRKKNPALLLGVALLVMVAGSFLILLQTGINARTAKQIHYGFSFRGAALAAATYVSDVERGAGIVRTRASSVIDDYFSGLSGSSSAPAPAASSYQAGGYGSREDEVQGQTPPEGDAFEKYYEKHYGKGSSEASWDNGSGGGFAAGGAGFSSGGASASFQAAPSGGASAAAAKGGAQETQTAKGGETGGKESAAAAGPAFGQASGRSSPPDRVLASLPSGGANLPGTLPAKPPRTVGQQHGGQAAASGGLNGFRNGGAAADLNTGLEKDSTGAKNDYSAKMSGGAAAAAAAGAAAGGGVPNASKPSAATGGAGGSSSASDGGGASGGDDKTASAKKSGGAEKAEPSGGGSFWGDGDEPQAAQEKAAPSAAPGDLIKTVVTETRNGEEAAYLTAEDDAAQPEETQLQTGAVTLLASAKSMEEPDPENLDDLSTERRAELRKQMHSFMKRVQNKYGKLTDIFVTSCSETPESRDLCKQNGLTRNYLTMTTAKGAKLVMGVKYVKKRWRRYTVSFSKPGGMTQGAPQTGDEEEDLGQDEEE